MNTDADDHNKVIDVAGGSQRSKLVENTETANSSDVVVATEEGEPEAVVTCGEGESGDDVELVSLSPSKGIDAASAQSKEQPHSDQFCCPLTKQPFQEPVAHCQGDSFEQEAVQKKYANDVFCPNRALKEHFTSKTDAGSHDNERGRISRSCSPQTGTTVPKLKDCFYCPTTCLSLRDPVIDPEGNTYERHAIEAWIKKHGDSPIARNPLKLEQLYDNTTLLSALVKEVQLAEDTFTTEEIEEWKKEMSDVPKADPPLSAKELEHALRPPTALPDPSLSALREALRAPTVVPDPSLSALREALGQGQGAESVLPHPSSCAGTMQEQDPDAQNATTTQTEEEEENDRATQQEEMRVRNSHQNLKRRFCCIFLSSLAIAWVILGAIAASNNGNTGDKSGPFGASGEFGVWMLMLGIPILGGIVLCHVPSVAALGGV